VRHPIVRFGIIGSMVLMAAGAIACSGTPDRECFSSLSSITSPAPNTITLHGSFYSNESLIVSLVNSPQHVASGTPASDRDTFTLTGIPSGYAVYSVTASCDQGQQSLGSAGVTVQ
jgi:hypothetical protein